MNVSKEKFEQAKRDEYERGHKTATSNMQIVHAADITRIREDTNATIESVEQRNAELRRLNSRQQQTILQLSEELANYRVEAIFHRERLQGGVAARGATMGAELRQVASVARAA